MFQAKNSIKKSIEFTVNFASGGNNGGGVTFKKIQFSIPLIKCINIFPSF